ncbi:hypothetical protein ABW20_dc0103245 [Dactylellina cionopaga]|nr:hypothetical protein ABW20_dc0103245 [Dactylellina cionopaga]
MAGLPLIVHSISTQMLRVAKATIRILILSSVSTGLLELFCKFEPIRGIFSKLIDLKIPYVKGILVFLTGLEVSSSVAFGLLAAGFLLKWVELFIDWSGTDYFDLREQLDKAKEASFRPRFFFSTTRHLRLNPNSYFFQYPILYVGFTTRFVSSVGSIFSVKESMNEVEYLSKNPRRKPNWFTFFSVDPKNFMSSRFGLDEKARRFLRLNDIDDTLFPHIYVVTAPSFLWWTFNPITYYYVYDENLDLCYTILEVSNTFQESHAYLLPRKGSPVKNDKFHYTYAFPKSFHISPFNKRAGEYEVDILDPIAAGRFDIKIALLDEAGKRRMTVQTLSLGKLLDILEATWVDVVKMLRQGRFGSAGGSSA